MYPQDVRGREYTGYFSFILAVRSVWLKLQQQSPGHVYPRFSLTVGVADSRSVALATGVSANQRLKSIHYARPSSWGSGSCPRPYFPLHIDMSVGSVR